MAVQNPRKVLIIGGGASGIVAAISARRMGAEVTLLERNPCIGKKILVTGNGRCNLTNIYTDIGNYHGANPKFVYGVFARFGVPETLDFFKRLGVDYKVEDQGRVFPKSDRASDVLDALRHELDRLGVEILYNACVADIKKDSGMFVVKLKNGMSIKGDRVVLSAGGKAMPSTGSDGSGFELARMAGHKIVDIFPSLVQLRLKGTFFKQLEGLKFKGTAGVLSEGKMLAWDSGEILFTSCGFSGPPILQISRKAAELLNAGKEAILKVIILDGMGDEEILAMLDERFRNMPKKTLEHSLAGIIPRRMVAVLLREAGVSDIRCRVSNLCSEDRMKIVNILKDWRLTVEGTRSWESAQVTAGGVDTREINPQTMESRLVKGLFFSGEIVDIDGECGGFNLQWAWSSGYVAGQSAAL